MTSVRVAVELSPAEAWFLSDKAERAGLELSEWIHAVIVAGHSQSLPTRERVRVLHAAGMSDGEMSQRLNVTRLVIANHRRSLGLPARKLVRK